jgi:NAD(P)-dependent dehydrogenase (short-subunit alcohol dehydrogenase family)
MTATVNGTDRFSLEGQCALVTGAGAGLGKAIALELAEAGAAVLVIDRDAQTAGRTASEIMAAGGRAQALAVDLGTEDGPVQACAAAISAFGRIDVLVNNAGIYPPGGILPDIDWQVHERTYAINVFGALRFIAEAARHMPEGSRIINMSSMESLRPSGPGLSHYSATKAALNAITRAAAVDLAGRRIRVNAILPGLIRTEGTSAMPDATFDFITQRAPSGRVGEPEDIAGAARFLACAASAYVNGHCLVVDGGMTIAG